jgi:hypothetical protein
MGERPRRIGVEYRIVPNKVVSSPMALDYLGDRFGHDDLNFLSTRHASDSCSKKPLA